MKNRLRWRGVATSLLLAVLAVPSTGLSASLQDSLPVDPAVRIGRLPNGITYYIRKNTQPEKRVSLRLAVKAGSVLEDDDQAGLAHFLEHMNFNGTAHFKAGELVAYLESIGARFGADANAYTSFDETAYMLDIPTDKEGLVDRGFLVLSDFAARATLSDAEIDKERGVVLEEWRLGQGAESRIQRQQYPVIWHGSRYAERLPIGKPDVIRSFRSERLRDFFRTWYRPERMAVVAVGDIDPDVAEARIRERFADIPRSPDSKPLPVYEVPRHEQTLFNVATDPEARGTWVEVVFKHPRRPEETLGDYRRELVERLFHSMVNARFSELARKPDAPFLNASSSDGSLGQTVETYNLWARVPGGGIAPALQSLLVEIARVRQHGFAAAELERAKKWVMARFERAHNERDKTESGSLVREYAYHFFQGGGIPGIENEYRLVQELLPGITLTEVAAQSREFIHEDNRVVLAAAPSQAGVEVPVEADLRKATASVASADITPWQDGTAGRELMEKKPAPGRVTATRRIEELDVTVLTLSNGVEVWLKPTDFKHDQIVFNAYSLGGASLADPKSYFDAVLSPPAVGEAGIGGFTPVDLSKLLAGRLAGGSPWVGSYTHGFSGSSTPKDLETALQLVYLHFTAPADRPESFEVLRKRLRGAVVNAANDPAAVYAERLREVNTRGHYMARALKTENVEALKPEPGLRFYKDRFANAADFTFFFAGAFSVEQVTPLLAQYLGSLPSQGKRVAAFVDRGLAFPDGVQNVRVLKGREPKSQTTLTFFADTGFDEVETYRARAAASVLRARLRELLREELSSTYGVSVGYSGSEPLPHYGTLTIAFGCAPENTDKLLAAALAEIERQRNEGPAQADLESVQEIDRRELESALKQNGFWLGALQNAHLLGRNPLTINRRRELIDGLTREDVRGAFRRYFPLDRHTVVSLFPEAAGTPPAGDGGLP